MGTRLLLFHAGFHELCIMAVHSDSDCVLQKVIGEFEVTQNAMRQLEESKKKLELDLRNTKKQFEAQELVCTCTVHALDKYYIV